MTRAEKYFKLKRDEKFNIFAILILSIFLAVLALSTIFSAEIEYILKLQYNTSNFSNSLSQVHFVDVGQGDCILIRFDNNKTMIIDSGPKAGKDKLSTYLNNIFFKNEEKVFDYAVLTHLDSDHSSNFYYIIDNFKIGKFYIPANLNEESDSVLFSKIIEKNIETEFNIEGINLVVSEQSNLSWFSPTSNYNESDNEYSPIILANLCGKKFLFTGDATKEMENVACYKYDLSNIDVLKAGHHGSSSSTSSILLESATPQNIVFCVGKNTYGQPSREVLQNIMDYEAENNTKVNIYSTLSLGNLIFKIDNDLELISIDNVNNYAYFSWWIIVVLLEYTAATYFVVRKKYVKKMNKNNG